jgi:hypothetical protein|eukprot:COSAG01_NODE_3202_length_6424_cov_634.991781_2_plen_68_part_00
MHATGTRTYVTCSEGMLQVGIVSRRACIEGSTPDPLEQEHFDMVAFSGQVCAHDAMRAAMDVLPRSR